MKPNIKKGIILTTCFSMLVGYATFSNTSALEDDSPIEDQSEIDEISDLDSTVTIGGLTFLAEDGQPLVQGVDYEEISESIKYLNTSGSLTGPITNKMIGIKTSRSITVSGNSTTHGIRIMPGTKGNLTLDGVTITAPLPIDVATNLTGTATGSTATKGTDIINRTTLYLTLADGSKNTLTANQSYSFAGIHCGEGSELVIDDSIHNLTNDGREIVPLQGRIPFDCTLSDNATTLKEHDPAWMMDSQNPGTLTVKGGTFAAGIGGENGEESGKMTINGGIINASTWASGDGIASAGTGIGGGCNGGVGYASENSGLTFNGGQINAVGSYHGAAIGAGYGNSTATKNTNVRGAILINKHRGDRSGCAGTPIPGDITVNGGYIEAKGGAHGNAVGGACVSSTNAGHFITVNGGTLKPTSQKTTTSYNIGAYGGNVIVTGGSFPIEAQSSGGYDGLSFEGSGVYAADGKTKLMMVKIDLSSYEGLEAGDKLYSYNVMVDGKPLSSEYGLANRVDTDKQLYFWIPASAKGQEVSIANVKLMNKDGNIVDTEYPFTLPDAGNGSGGNVTKRYVLFEVDTDKFSDELKKLINKRYDGLAFDYDLLKDEIVKQEIVVPQPKDEVIDKIDELDINSVRVSDKDGKPVSDVSSKDEFSKTGNYNITVNYNEFSKDANFSKTFWGHQTVLSSTITSADSYIFNADYDVTYYTDSEGNKQVDKMNLRASVRPKDGEALTCEAPEGYVQFYINGVKVGAPQALTKVTSRATEDSNGYQYSNASVELQFQGNDQYPKVPDMTVYDEDIKDPFVVTARYYDGTNYTDAKGRVTAVDEEDQEPENFPYVTPPITVVTPKDPNELEPDEELDGDYRKPDRVELEEKEDGDTILHSYVKDALNAYVEDGMTKEKSELIDMMNSRYGFANSNNTVVQVGDKALTISDIKITDEDGNETDVIDLSSENNYVIETTVEDANGNKTTIHLNYAIHDLEKDGPIIEDVDTDGDGFPDINIDTDGDGKPDINVDTDGDGKPDVNIDTDDDGKPDINIVDKDGDGKPDSVDEKDTDPNVNIDTDGDGQPDINIDTDGDGQPDIDIDTDGDGKPDVNIDTDDDGKPDVNIDTDDDGKPDINIDTDGDNKPDIDIVDKDGDGKPDDLDDLTKEEIKDLEPDINIDSDGDGKPDVNVDTDGDGKPDVNIDTDGDGKPDINIVDKDKDGQPDNIDPKDPNQDTKPDVNIDTDGDGKPDINIDTDGDGKPDIDIDTDDDGKPDINIDTDDDGKPDINIDTNDDGKPDVDIVDKDGDGKPDDLDDLTKEEIKDLEPNVNVDTDGDGKPDINVDTDKDGKPDINIDTDGDGKPDINIDTDKDGKPNIDIDTDGDGKPDVNLDTDGDGKADINIDTDGDGKADINIDTDGDGKADINLDTDGDGKADANIDTDGDGIADTNLLDVVTADNVNLMSYVMMMLLSGATMLITLRKKYIRL